MHEEVLAASNILFEIDFYNCPFLIYYSSILQELREHSVKLDQKQ